MKRVDRYLILLVIILLIGLSVRIWGLNYDLPYIYHPDEPPNILVIQHIFKTGDLNPHIFQYPSLFYYINALGYIPYYLFGKLLGIFVSRNDILAPISLAMGVTRAPLPSIVMMGRIITVIFGIGCVGLTYLVGKQLTNKAIVGLIASLMVAISLPNVSLSRFITPDTFVVFFASATFLSSVLIYQQGKTRYYVLAGICAGLTASTKYNAGLIVLPIILAHFLHYGWHSLKNKNVYIALLLCGIAFLATTPFSVLDFSKFWADMTFVTSHYSTGHAGMEGHTLQFYVDYMWRTGGILYILSLVGIIYGIFSRSKESILLASFPVVYFAFIASIPVRNDRTFLPLTPFLFLSAAAFLVLLFNQSSNLQLPDLRKATKIGLVCLGIIAIALPVSATVEDTVRLTALNSRETSRVWIDNNLPSGAKIALESYSPFVNPDRFSVKGVGMMIDHAPDWYISNGFEYLVFSQWMYGRYYYEPERYSTEVAKYNEFFNRFMLVKMFNDGNYEIRIYKVSLAPNASSHNGLQMQVFKSNPSIIFGGNSN